MIDTPPAVYRFWSKASQDRYDERICIMREANNIPDHAPTPQFIVTTAMLQAADNETEIAGWGKTLELPLSGASSHTKRMVIR